MNVALLSKKHKGIFISINKHWKGAYIHFKKHTRRFFFDGKFRNDKYSTIGFNRMIEIEKIN